MAVPREDLDGKLFKTVFSSKFFKFLTSMLVYHQCRRKAEHINSKNAIFTKLVSMESGEVRRM